MSLSVKILSPEKTLFTGDVDGIVVPGTLGSFEILTDHAPIISSLEKGNVVYTKDGVKQSIQITGGFVEVQKNKVSLCIEVD